jgi:hypothetical protein
VESNKDYHINGACHNIDRIQYYREMRGTHWVSGSGGENVLQKLPRAEFELRLREYEEYSASVRDLGIRTNMYDYIGQYERFYQPPNGAIIFTEDIVDDIVYHQYAVRVQVDADVWLGSYTIFYESCDADMRSEAQKVSATSDRKIHMLLAASQRGQGVSGCQKGTQHNNLADMKPKSLSDTQRRRLWVKENNAIFSCNGEVKTFRPTEVEFLCKQHI